MHLCFEASSDMMQRSVSDYFEAILLQAYIVTPSSFFSLSHPLIRILYIRVIHSMCTNIYSAYVN